MRSTGEFEGDAPVIKPSVALFFAEKSGDLQEGIETMSENNHCEVEPLPASGSRVTFHLTVIGIWRTGKTSLLKSLCRSNVPSEAERA